MRKSTYTSRLAIVATSVAMVAGLAACAAPASTPVASYPAPYATGYPAGTVVSSAVEYGRITNVEVINTNAPPKSNAAGIIIGGIAGAVVGHQVGNGTGKDLATIAGGVGGAFAGNAIQNNANANRPATQAYRVSVQVDNGAYRAYDLSAPGDLRAGDRVRIENGILYRI